MMYSHPNHQIAPKDTLTSTTQALHPNSGAIVSIWRQYLQEEEDRKDEECLEALHDVTECGDPVQSSVAQAQRRQFLEYAAPRAPVAVLQPAPEFPNLLGRCGKTQEASMYLAQ